MAIELYEHLFDEPYPPETAIWDVLAADEPGGIVIRATPAIDQVKLTLFQYHGEYLWPTPDQLPEILPAAEGLVNYWEFAAAIHKDAARTIARHGVIGLRSAWEPGSWGAHGHGSIFPFEHFLYLAVLLKHRSPRSSLLFAEELELLHFNERPERQPARNGGRR